MLLLLTKQIYTLLFLNIFFDTKISNRIQSAWLHPLSLEYGPTARRKGNQGAIGISHPLLVKGESLVTTVSNDFTIDFWVQVQDSSAVYPQDNSSSYAPDHRVYAIYPDTLSTLAAGLGVAVGTNNISVVERYGSVNPSVLSYTITDPSEYLAGWNHITIVYANKIPYLYVNGHFKQSGVGSLRSVVHPSYNLVQQTREHALALDELRIWSRELLQEEITAIVQRDTLNSFRLGSLELYMPFTGSDAGVVQDHSGNGYHYRLPVSATAQLLHDELLVLPNYEEPMTPLVRSKTPRHRLLSSYGYNSLGQVSYQLSPDAGRSEYWYDELGRLVYSQNAQQAQVEQDSLSLSYTKYEPVLGRIIEVGKLTLSDTSGLRRFMHQDTIALLHSRGRRTEITQTWYDAVAVLGYEFESSLGQQHLSNRVSASVYRLYDTTTTDGIESVQYYSYDVSGNVQTQWNYLEGLGLKRMDYEYDEQSGKVNLLKYQHGEPDAFYYRYRYDGENRLLSVESGNWLLPYSSRIIEGTTEAQYRYYLHGPLARMELGQQGVQGLDYAYTLQGWLKGVNAQRLNVNWDMGADGKSGSVHAGFGRDVMGYSLGYYQGDYVSLLGAGGSNAFRMTLQADTITAHASVYGVGADLYNGNISNMMLSLRGARSNLPYIQGYRYDQLNRLTRVRTTFNSNPGITDWSLNSSYYRNWEDFSYDGNGNIVSVQRYPNTTSLMDNQTYHYNRATDPITQESYLLTNRLRHVTDVIGSNVSSSDIDNQSADNYSYDAIGNLVGDVSEGLTVRWNVYGKIAEITKAIGGNQHIGYGYDGSGSRIRKTITSGGNTTHTYYVKDASGNVLGVYEKRNDSIIWKEQHLYGSSRLGIWYPDTAVSEENRLKLNGLIGRRHYELSNHLGNVMAVISDKKVVQADQSYYPEMIDVYDYYAFGGLRDFTKIDSILAGGRGYRYGFNGKENDSEVKGEGNQQDYGMRVYDPRLGRFLSVDPLTKGFPFYTPYQFAGNMPVWAIDLDGAEPIPYWKVRSGIYGEKPRQVVIFAEEVVEGVGKSLMQGLGAISELFAQMHYGDRIKSADQQEVFPLTGGKNVVDIAVEAATAPVYTARKIVEDPGDGKNWGEGLFMAYAMKSLVKPKPRTNVSKLDGRSIIVDENLSPQLVNELKSSGFNVKTFEKATLDADIIKYAQENNSIVLTNNIKDFRGKVTTFKVSENMKRKTETGKVVQAIENVNKKVAEEPSIIEKGKNVSLAEYQ